MPDNNGRTTVVIFGATGDLTKRKLVPALFHLHRTGALPALCQFLGVARSEHTDDSFREHLRDEIEDGVSDGEWRDFASLVHYHRGSSNDVETLKDLDHRIVTSCEEGQRDNRLYYLALAPSLYPGTLTALGDAAMLGRTNGARRVVIEKPFGSDLRTARDLNRTVHSVLDESQVFRIDHYLGKDTVQNLLVFRFANTIFEPLWNRNYVDHVQISVLESLDVEGRGDYYDRAGILRDMFQSHLMQLLTLIAMEPPATGRPEALRDEKAKVLTSVRRLDLQRAAENSVRGQYEGYRRERNVDPESHTATFGAIRLFIDNWRWHGVPFFLRSGKALNRKSTDILVQFRRPPQTLFDMQNSGGLTPNELHISVQPNEGVHLLVENKAPGSRMGAQAQELEFYFPKGQIRDAYERLLLDAINGDASLFTRADEIERAWEITDPFVEAWNSPSAPELHMYRPGSPGPDAAEQLLGAGRNWLVQHTPGHD